MPDTLASRDQELQEFDQHHRAFDEVIRAAPERSLRHRPTGEDYALGGLVVHVVDVLAKYTALLQLIRSADFGEVREQPRTPTDEDAALIRDGFDAKDRPAILDRMSAAHAAFSTALRELPPDTYDRIAPVIYAGSTTTYDTRPRDVMAWVSDHYTEHVVQVRDLLSAWRDPG